MDKRKLIIMSIVTLLLLGTTLLYVLSDLPERNFNLASVVVVGVPLIAIIFMLFFIIRGYKDVKAGMPLKDERSRRVLTNTAAKSFYVTLYWLLAIGWFEEPLAKAFGVERMTASQATSLGIAGMALLFFGFWLYYDRKGKLV